MTRIYFYSHDAQGLGHFRRNLNLSTTIVHKFRDASCVLITGAQFPTLFRLPVRCDFVKIPTLRKTSTADYNPLLPESTLDILVARSQVVRHFVQALPPDVFIVDRHAGGLRGELLSALRWLRKHAPSCRIVLGLREVLDEPAVLEQEWEEDETLQNIERFYDQVWIYGDPAVFPTLDIYPFTSAVRAKAHYCGYLVPRRIGSRTTPADTVRIVASVGGGADGYRVLSDSVAALQQLSKRFALTANLFTGPLMSKTEFEALRRQCSNGYRSMIHIERFSPRFLSILASADLVLTMGGYNSVVEGVRLGKRMIVIPRVTPRREQFMRACAFAGRDLLRYIDPCQLTPEAITSAAEALLASPPPTGGQSVNFGASAEVPRLIRHLLSTHTAGKQ